MAETAQQYFGRMFKDAGIPEADTAAILKHFENEKLASGVNEMLRRGTDDFNAMQGRVKAAEAKVTQYDQEWYPKANGEYQRALRDLETAKAQLAALGAGDSGAPPDLSRFLTKEDLEKQRTESDARYAAVIKSGLRLASRHAARYSEELDVDALEKLAVEKGLNLEQAYKEWVEPREKKAAEEAHGKAIEKAKEEAVRDYASKHQLPVDPAPVEQSFLFRPGAKAPEDMDQELLAAWRGGK